ncbi:MAG: hypothetical protein AAFN78_14035, partial [Pseudomonadota bacterium]
HDLGLAFRYAWLTSDEYGFVRRAELENLGDDDCQVAMIDGLRNLLPAGTPRFTQTNSSYLVDAYKWSELDESTGVALLTLFSAISDRAEPCESLRATTLFSLGLDDRRILLSTDQLDRFREGNRVETEVHKRGIRGAYLLSSTLSLAAAASHEWQIVANVERSQAEAVSLIEELADPASVAARVSQSVDAGTDALARLLAAGDGFQKTAEENVSAHHYANVLYNVLRGGIVADQYRVNARDFCAHLALFNRGVYERHRAVLDGMPETLDFPQLRDQLATQNDPQLERLVMEYLPITFGRRHGDPSRPWNQFAIRLRDAQGNPLLTYQGNWRDIFQNWEALLLSYPEFIDNVIAKFVNASTVDGYNPYRITNEGIDWEVEEPDDPWSYIGYWGDHQIIYLQKLLELSRQFYPGRLHDLLHREVFSYANVPYRIRDFQAVIANAKSTVDYDDALAERIEERVAKLGADGKLLLDSDGDVLQVSLLEKLLVALLAKLGNLVVDGGIWLNTQRPEWNDANNALVGQGLSMVTLYYLRRYITFLQELLEGQDGQTGLSSDVATWLGATATALADFAGSLNASPVDDGQRHALLVKVGTAASDYRMAVYAREGFDGKQPVNLSAVHALLGDALTAIDHSVAANRRDDGLYHAYNVLDLTGPDTAGMHTLYPMLEGQVAALSAGAIGPEEAVTLLEALFASDVYRANQSSFLLYPDRKLPRFLEKNQLPADRVEAIAIVARMHGDNEQRLVERDARGVWRFNASLSNVGDLMECIDSLLPVYGDQLEAARDELKALYEEVFDHKSFTGRSGGMFGFEGLGSIYWHMVSKLLLAVQENFFAARDAGADASVVKRLGELYYRVREGIGFNKTPAEYGAFPTDPYSHTPGHSGAQQPGMTGQVKEEMLTRFAELGLRVEGGAVRFDPSLLRPVEFLDDPSVFRYLDVDGNWQEIDVPAHGLAHTWCQVPLVYQLADDDTGVTLTLDDGTQHRVDELALSADMASEIYRRSGRLRRIDLRFGRDLLFSP